MTEQDRQISEVVAAERSRLRNFIRRRVPDPRDAEDILQEVFYELVEANRLLMPIEHVTGWLFRVARNRITDLFRKKKPERFGDAAVADEDGAVLQVTLHVVGAEHLGLAAHRAAAQAVHLPQSILSHREAQAEVQVRGRGGIDVRYPSLVAQDLDLATDWRAQLG